MKVLILILPSFSLFSFFFLLSPSYNTYGYFSVIVFSATTCLRILKVSTRLDSDELYCAKKEQPQIAYKSLYLFIFFLSNENFCHRFLSSYWSYCFQILCTPSGTQSVLCKWKWRCLFSLCLLFFIFFFCHPHIIHMDIFLSKISQQLLVLGFWNLVQSLIVMRYIVLQKKQLHIAYQSLYLFIFFLSNENFWHRFLSSYLSHCFQILCTSSGRQSVLYKWKSGC